MEIQKVQWESRKEIEGLFSKFERVNQIFDKKTVHMEEELALGAKGDVLTQYIASTLLVLGQ